METDNDLKTCPICFEDYEKEGNHVPRLLPCTHTLCEQCIGSILAKRILICPVCRARHRTTAAKGVKAFLQNKYILESLNISKDSFSMCTQHRRDLSLYCKDTGCELNICQLCFLNSHRTHNVVDIVEEKRMTLVQNISDLTKELEQFKDAIQNRNQEFLQQNNAIQDVEELVKQLSFYYATFDGIHEIAQEVKVCNSLNDDESNKILNSVTQEPKSVIHGIKKEAEALATLQEIKNQTEVLESIKKTFYETREKAAVSLQWVKYSRAEDKTLILIKANCMTFPPPKIEDLEMPTCMETLSDGCIVVGGVYKNNVCALRKLEPCHGVILGIKELQQEPYSIAEVRLAGLPAIAVSYNCNNVVEFYSADNLEDYVCSCLVNPYTPRRLCTASPSVLLLEDIVTGHVIRLNCNVWPPKLEDAQTFCPKSAIWTMCCSKQLFLVTGFDGSVSAYDDMQLSDSLGKPKWSVNTTLTDMPEKMHAYSKALDEEGNLFVCDIANKCVQMFSLDGSYIGCVYKSVFGTPLEVGWCKKWSALVIVSEDGTLSMVQLGSTIKLEAINFYLP